MILPSRNPYLDEIDAAHASLSDPAKAALEKAHASLMTPPAPEMVGMTGGATPSPAPSAPQAITPPPARPVPSLTPAPTPEMQGHSVELNRLQQSGSGIDQIKNPVGRTFAHIAEGIGGLFPALTAAIPGTQLHHNVLLGQAEGAVKNDQDQMNEQSKRELEGAQTKAQESLPEFRQGQVENAADKNTNAVTHEANVAAHNAATLSANHEKLMAQTNAKLAKDGYVLDPETMEERPMKQEEMSDPAQAKLALTRAQSDEQTALKEYHKAQTEGVPVKLQQAEQRLATARQNSAIASQNASIRQAEYNMHAHGTDEHGKPLSGIPTTEDGAPIGTTVYGQTKPTTAARQASERGQTLQDLDKRIRAGLSDPEIQKYMGVAGGRLAEAQGHLGNLPPRVAEFKNDLVSYGAFQAGLHPVRGIGGLQYFDKVMGGLGQTPEQLKGKLDSNLATVKSVRHVAGQGPGPTSSGKVTMAAPDGTTTDVDAADVEHYQKLGAKVVKK